MDTQERGRADRAEATRKIREADREVVRIYQKALDDMTRKARAAGEGTAGRRWAEEMQRTYKRRISEMAGDIEGTITSAMQETAKIPAKSGAERISEIYSKAGGRLSAETFSDMYARVPEEAIRAVISGRAYLDGKSLSGRIWTQAGRLEGGINEIIKQGLAQQKSTAEIARELEQYVNPNAHETIAERRERVKRQAALPFAGNIEYNCQRLARTSINHAFFLATKEYAALSPFCKAIHWELSDDHFTRQVLPFGADICDEYATHDEGLGIGNWPVEGVPLPHAQCLCCQWPEEGGTLEECAERLGAWLSGCEDAELDKAYGQWKHSMVSGMPNKRLSEIRDDAGEKRKQLITQIAGRNDFKSLSIAEQQRVMSEMNNAGERELISYARSGIMALTERDPSIARARKAIARADKTLNAGAQQKHIRGSGHYIEGRSYIYGDAEYAQELINRYSGTGTPQINLKDGEWVNKETIEADEPVGVSINMDTGEETPTKCAKIHYGRNGTHIVPTMEGWAK